jgi:hypothetical protein
VWKQAAVEDGPEEPAHPGHVERIGDDEVDLEAALGNLAPGDGDRGRRSVDAMASSPRSAAMSACSPVPQPMSSTGPTKAPVRASARSAGCGGPMSHGGASPW